MLYFICLVAIHSDITSTLARVENVHKRKSEFYEIRYQFLIINRFQNHQIKVNTESKMFWRAGQKMHTLDNIKFLCTNT